MSSRATLLTLTGVLVSVGLGLSSCATIANQAAYWERSPSGPFGKSLYIFGGTICDVCAPVVAFTSSNGEGSEAALLIFDLPFSLAADVVLLPLCIYQQIDRATWKEGEFIPQLDDRDANVRAKAAWALGALGGTSHATVEALTKSLGDADFGVRANALRSLGALGTQSASAGPAVVQLLATDSQWQVRMAAATALGEIGAERSAVIPALIDALGDSSASVRCPAVQSLAKIDPNDTAVRDALRRALEDTEPSVREAAERALQGSR